jgi:hypothetical protein
MKTQGVKEVKHVVQEILDLEKRKKREKRDIEREVKLLNQVGS